MQICIFCPAVFFPGWSRWFCSDESISRIKLSYGERNEWNASEGRNDTSYLAGAVGACARRYWLGNLPATRK